MDDSGTTAARDRVLIAAERLFSERGYKSVTLRDIAEALGIRQASLYHHFPGGKEELFVEVTQRGLERHRQALEQAIQQAGPDLADELQAVAAWLLSQPPIDVARLVRSDLRAISEIHARRLTQAVSGALITPLEHAFAQARESDAYQVSNPALMAGLFLSLIEGIRIAEHFSLRARAELAADTISVLLDGLRRR